MPPSFLSCPIAKRRWEFIRQCGLSLKYFDPQFFICYCSSHPENNVTGERAGKTYRLPKGWTGFSLKLDAARCSADSVFAKWPVAYHGTTVTGMKGIVEVGTLLPPGARDPSGTVIGARNGRPGRSEEEAPKDREGCVFFSPLVDYATHTVHSSWELHPIEGRVRVALQLRVRPGYRTHHSTIKGFSVADGEQVYRGQEEWLTDRHGSICVYRVLVQDDGTR